VIEYLPIIDSGQDRVSLYSKLSAMKRLISCLMPDMAMLLWQGKLDSAALSDCVRFMEAAVANKRIERLATSGGYVLYYMLLLERMTFSRDYRKVIDYCVRSVSEQNHVATQTTSLVVQWLTAIHRIKEQLSTNPLAQEDKVIFWHNMRTDVSPPGYEELVPNDPWYAFKLDAVCNVIYNITKERYSPKEIIKALKLVGTSNARTDQYCNFVDLARVVWPLTKSVYSDANQCTEVLPLRQQDIEPMICNFQPAVYIRKAYFDQSIALYTADNLTDVSLIEINSVEHVVGRYKFVETIEQGVWFGFRAIKSTVFGKYCGLGNKVLITDNDEGFDVDPNIDSYNESFGYGSLADCYELHYLAQVYGTDGVPTDLAPCLKLNPFEFRNNEYDDVTMPDDDASTYFHENGCEWREDDLRSGSRAVSEATTPSSRVSSNRGGSYTPLSEAQVRSKPPRSCLKYHSQPTHPLFCRLPRRRTSSPSTACVVRSLPSAT
tara:strand:- start:741 stop:2213 length:1473 start_codon:yes stop_codon:yes gene_type:complete